MDAINAVQKGHTLYIRNNGYPVFSQAIFDEEKAQEMFHVYTHQRGPFSNSWH